MCIYIYIYIYTNVNNTIKPCSIQRRDTSNLLVAIKKSIVAFKIRVLVILFELLLP